jgi:serine O-acetyltransferase
MDYLEIVRTDLVRMSDTGVGRSPGAAILVRLAVHPRFRAIVNFRAAQALFRRPLTRPIASWLTGRTLRMCGAELAPGSVVGPGLCFVHTTGVVIGQDVVAGARLTLHQGVTLGDQRGGAGQPTVGDDVFIGAGAKVLGGITIGDRVVVAANAVVVADVPAGSVVAGVPARVIASEATSAT